MSLPEPQSHTFLIRIWIEGVPQEAGRLSWRGHVTHLPDEERCRVETFEEITRFMRGYVGGEMGGAGTTTSSREGVEPPGGGPG